MKDFIMKRTLTYHISEPQINILSFLKEKGYSNHLITQLKKTDTGIRKNGAHCYVTKPLQPGDLLEICWSEEETSEGILPVKLPFPVIYEDEDILLVNKPAGMPIHPSINHYEDSLANAAMYYFAEKQKPFTFRCINRLDRDTSGLTILAKNMLSAGVLGRNTGIKSIQRIYLAIVTGKTPLQGTVDAPIAREAESVITRCIDPVHGAPAITHYTQLYYDEVHDLSLVRLKLETGRTHQIRLHMKHIGYPLIGDFLYHPDFLYIKRQALHAAALSFAHPITGKKMHFSAPLPEDMKNCFSYLPEDIYL